MRVPLVNNTPGEIRIFRDGVEVITTREQFSDIPDFDELNTNGVNLGGINFQFLRGYIDAAAFFTNDLTVAEVATLDTAAPLIGAASSCLTSISLMPPLS
jgi:hypothetical protein